jgi:hypothetical protein
VLGIARDLGRGAARLASLSPALALELATAGEARAVIERLGARIAVVAIDREIEDAAEVVELALSSGIPCAIADGAALSRDDLARIAEHAAPAAIGGGGVGTIALATLAGRARAGDLGALRRAIVRLPGGRRRLPAASRRNAFDRDGRTSFAVVDVERVLALLVPAARALEELVPGAAGALAITDLQAPADRGDRIAAHALLGDVELELDLDRAMVGDEDWEIEAEHEGGSRIARFRGTESEALIVRAHLRKPTIELERAPVEALLTRHLLAAAREGRRPSIGDPRRVLAVHDACRAMLTGAEARRAARAIDVVLVHVPRYRNAFDELRLPSLAIARLAAYLRGHGIDTAVADLEARFAQTPLSLFADDPRVARWLEGARDPGLETPLEAMWAELSRALRGDRPTLIGISITDYFGHFQMNLASCLARLIHARTAHRVVLGGERDQVDGDRALAPGMPFDFVVDGDGEVALLALASMLAHRDRRPRSIPGVWSREGETVHKGALVRSHLGAMPRPDFDGHALEAYRARPSAGLLESARAEGIVVADREVEPFGYLPYGFVKGCTAECTFCSAKEHLDVQAPEKSVDELLALRDRHGVRDFVLLDNLVNVGARWLERFCRLLIDARADLQWTDSCRPTGISPELAATMREAGCLLLNFGAESGSDAVLSRMKKGLTAADIRATLRATHRAGIVNRVNLIAGYLHETEHDVDLTIAMVEELADEIDVIGCFQGFYLFEGMGIDPVAERIAIRTDYPRGLDRLKTGQHTIAYDELGGRRWEEKREAIDASRNRILARIEALGIRTVDKIDEHDLFWLSRRTRDKRVVRRLVLGDPPSGPRDAAPTPANRGWLPPGGQQGRVTPG